MQTLSTMRKSGVLEGEGVGRSKKVNDTGDDEANSSTTLTDKDSETNDVDECFKENEDEGDASDQDVELQENLDGP